MKITSINVKGWRSFNNEHGIELNNLKRFNLLIGPNNAGKSNLMKVLAFASSVIADKYNSETNSNSTIWELDSSAKYSISKPDFWSIDNPKIEIEISFEDLPAILDLHGSKALPASEGPNGSLILQINGRKAGSGNSYRFDMKPAVRLDRRVRFFSEPFFSQNREKILDDSTFFEPTKNGQKQQGIWIDGFLWRNLIDSLLFIEPIRDPKRTNNLKDMIFDGTGFLAEAVSAIRNSHDYEFQEKVQEWMRRYLDEPVFYLEETENALSIKLNRGKLEKNTVGSRTGMKKFSLEQLGTGISQILMMLIHLYLKRDESLNVFIDEPENSLHPASLVQFFTILETDDFKNHRFFVSTHAAALMDMVKEDWTVTRVSFNPETGSKYEPCITNTEKLHLLEDLGFRASQVLQTNVVIWVEGPSDIIYIRKWIESWTTMNKIQLLEGRHFSFLFYGGSNLKSIKAGEFDEEDEVLKLIDTFRTSRFSVIVMDSDRDPKTGKQNGLILPVTSMIEKDEKAKEFLHLWVTDGREIENNVPSDLWNKAMHDPSLRKQTIIENGQSVNLGAIFPVDFQMGQGDDFSQKLIEFYDLTPLQDKSTGETKIKRCHDDNKVSFARFFASNWETEHFSKAPGLGLKMEEIVAFIQKANGMG